MHKLTSKRQVTIPQEVCAALGLTPGDYVEIFERDGVAHLVKMESASLAGQFATGKKVPVTAVTRKAAKSRAAAKFKRG